MGPPHWRDGWGRRGARYYPEGVFLTVHDALDFLSFVCFLVDVVKAVCYKFVDVLVLIQ